MLAMDEHALIRRSLDGDARALEDLVERWRRPLYGYLLRMSGQRADAEDLFQETWLRVWRALPDYQERQTFSSYLFTVASRLCIDRSRRLKTSRGHFEEERDEAPLDQSPGHDTDWPDRLLEDDQARSLLGRAVEGLPELQRQTVLLRLEAGLSFREIAEIRGEPIGTVLPRMHRALKRIRQTFKDNGYDVAV